LYVSPTFACPFSAGDILSRIRLCQTVLLEAMEVRVPPPALHPVLSKVVVFSNFAA
jgi:hypothetical protein